MFALAGVILAFVTRDRAQLAFAAYFGLLVVGLLVLNAVGDRYTGSRDFTYDDTTGAKVAGGTFTVTARKIDVQAPRRGGAPRRCAEANRGRGRPAH